MTDEMKDSLAAEIRWIFSVGSLSHSLDKVRDTLFGKPGEERTEDEILMQFEQAARWYGDDARIAIQVKYEADRVVDVLADGWPQDTWGDVREATEHMLKMRDQRLQGSMYFGPECDHQRLIEYKAKYEIAKLCHRAAARMNEYLEEDGQEPLDLSIPPTAAFGFTFG